MQRADEFAFDAFLVSDVDEDAVDATRLAVLVEDDLALFEEPALLTASGLNRVLNFVGSIAVDRLLDGVPDARTCLGQRQPCEVGRDLFGELVGGVAGDRQHLIADVLDFSVGKPRAEYDAGQIGHECLVAAPMGRLKFGFTAANCVARSEQNQDNGEEG